MAELKNMQHEMFCRQMLLTNFNKTQAAINAEYSEKTARQQGSRLFASVDIQQRICELMEERMKRTDIDADYVLRQAVKIHERCMQEVDPITTRTGDEIKDEDGKTIYAFDAKSAVAALKMVGEHINVQAFKHAVVTDHTSSDGSMSPAKPTRAEILEAQKAIDGELDGLD